MFAIVPYSKEFRREVLAVCDRGEGTRVVALRFQCSESCNRLGKLTDGEEVIQENQYDARSFRTAMMTSAGTRHFYYTPGWRCVEERVGSSTEAERQFVWGLRYIDDLILRDRDTDSDDIVDERLYALQDGNWNVVALADSEGEIQERFAYSAYGVMTPLTPVFAPTEEGFDWETTYAGYRWDAVSGMYAVRFRYYQPQLGMWMTRDPIGYAAKSANLMQYVLNAPTHIIDPLGLEGWWNRSLGVLQVVGGSIEVAGGLAMLGIGGVTEFGTAGLSSPISLPAMGGGLALLLHGYDNAVAGLNTAWTGQPYQTMTSRLVQNVVSPVADEDVAFAIGEAVNAGGRSIQGDQRHHP